MLKVILPATLSVIFSLPGTAGSSRGFAADSIPTAIWYNVTPAGVDLTNSLDCRNYGTQSAQVDTSHPGTVYTQFMCQGIWKSTDYGQTWTGPINTGTNGATVGDCAGGITVTPTAAAPTIYESCIRGNAVGFWKSTDGGVDWTRYSVVPPMPSTQDVYPPIVDPYDPMHLLMAAHEQNHLLESTNGGVTWSSIPLNSGMLEHGGTGAIFFINTGSSSTTRTTWLWMAQASSGTYGTWRTTNGGTSATWIQVSTNEHPHGSAQIYQPDTSGIVFIAGQYSASGDGVLRSTDYGVTWSHISIANPETVVTGTPKNIYGMFGFPIGLAGTNNIAFQLDAVPGTGTWNAPGTPTAMTQGPAQIAVMNDGTHNILIGAMWNSGLWRYVEP
ncbi:MAG TPA: hypothetical protein VIY90_20400 [Steroidobacteraceae bacterium]